MGWGVLGKCPEGPNGDQELQGKGRVRGGGHTGGGRVFLMSSLPGRCFSGCGIHPLRQED